MDKIIKRAFSVNSKDGSQDNVNNVIRNNNNVDNDDKDNKYVNNVNTEDLTEKELLFLLEKRFQSKTEKQKWLANKLASSLSDTSNLNYYRNIVSKHSAALLLECLSITNEALRDGIIRSTSAKFFVGVVKRKTSKSRG